jgi:hypothetical protein
MLVPLLLDEVSAVLLLLLVLELLVMLVPLLLDESASGFTGSLQPNTKALATIPNKNIFFITIPIKMVFCLNCNFFIKYLLSQKNRPLKSLKKAKDPI